MEDKIINQIIAEMIKIEDNWWIGPTFESLSEQRIKYLQLRGLLKDIALISSDCNKLVFDAVCSAKSGIDGAEKIASVLTGRT